MCLKYKLFHLRQIYFILCGKCAYNILYEIILLYLSIYSISYVVLYLSTNIFIYNIVLYLYHTNNLKKSKATIHSKQTIYLKSL